MILFVALAKAHTYASPRYAGMILVFRVNMDRFITSPRYAGMIRDRA